MFSFDFAIIFGHSHSSQETPSPPRALAIPSLPSSWIATKPVRGGFIMPRPELNLPQKPLRIVDEWSSYNVNNWLKKP